MDEAGATFVSARGKYQGWNDLVILALLSLPVGAATGFVGGLFRLSLGALDRWWLLAVEGLHGWGHGWTVAAFVLVVAVGALSAGLAAWMVRRVAPHASGSGIPHTEAVLRGELPTEPYRLLPVKFFGGALAIGSGLALGREGPIVQMGSTLGHLVSDLFRRPWPDCRVLMAAGAGAGVATAFNAPIAGALFVLEELVQRFEHRIAIAALGASAAALAIARTMLGNSVEFDVPHLDTVGIAGEPLFLVLGAVMGLLAVTYNWLLLGTADLLQKARWLPL